MIPCSFPAASGQQLFHPKYRVYPGVDSRVERQWRACSGLEDLTKNPIKSNRYKIINKFNML
jgi:hypothetical protein